MQPKKPARRRLVLTSEGGPGTGKTDFFYRTAPRPALVINLDLNGEGIEERYAEDDVLIKRVPVPPMAIFNDSARSEERRKQDADLFTEIRDLYRIAVEKDYFRSIMIDEGKALWELARRSYLHSLDFGAAKQTSYTPINGAMSRFYQLAKLNRFNLYIPHRQTDERGEHITQDGKKTSVPTGEKKYAGWSQALYESQCHLLLTKDDKWANGNGKDSLGKFDAVITKCTANTKIEGMMLSGEDITWANIGQLVFPMSEDSDWL